MPKKRPEPKIVKPEDIDPRHDWSRPIMALGQMAVDFEERVDFRRLHDYRLARTRQALAKSDLGAILTFDQHNIRYISSTVIGEWARDKLTRYCLLTGPGDPYVWDFGSAAKHHRLLRALAASRSLSRGAPGPARCDPSQCRAVQTRRRGDQVDPGGGRRRRHAARRRHGRAPHAVRAAGRSGIEVRDGQQMMLDARELKSQDELMLLNTSAAMVDGTYQKIAEALKPGIRESQIVALASHDLYEKGSDCVEAINAISGERCAPHPHNFTDRLIRPGDQAFFDIIQSYMGYRTCYYRTFNVGKATDGQRDAYKKAREWIDVAIDMIRPGVRSDEIAACWPDRRQDRLHQRDGGVRPRIRPRPGPGPARAADHQPPQLVRGADGDQGRHGVRA